VSARRALAWSLVRGVAAPLAPAREELIWPGSRLRCRRTRLGLRMRC